MKIPIIYEDENILVIDKPAGLLVHSSTSDIRPNSVKDLGTSPEKTLIDYFPKAKLAHRLDKDTSGLLLLAKNERTYNWLKSQFKNRQITKKYIALVHNKLKDEKGIITKTISKSRKRGGSQTTAPIGKRREAITRYKVLKEYCPKSDLENLGSGQKCYALLEARPKTGRTHQIRVHLASIGHPIAGDEKYKFKRQSIPKGLKRQFLHASYLKFSLPNGEVKEFCSNLPKDLEKILKNL